MFLAKGCMRSCEIDTYNEGCVPNSGYNISWDIEFTANSREALLEEILTFHDVKKDEILLENNKLFLEVLEKPLYDRWVKPDGNDLTRWRNDELELFLVIYSYDLYAKTQF